MKNNNSDRAIVKTLRHTEKVQAQPVQTSSISNTIGKWLDTILSPKPKKEIPKGFMEAFELLNDRYGQVSASKVEISKLLTSLQTVLNHYLHQKILTTTYVISLEKEIAVKIHSLYGAQKQYEEYRDICNKMIKDTYDKITPGQKVWNLGINYSVGEYTKKSIIKEFPNQEARVNHLRPIFTSINLLEQVKRCDNMLKAGQKPEAWPELPPMPAVLLKIDLPPASDIPTVDQFIASFLEQVQKDIRLGALDPSRGEEAVDEYVQALHLPEKVAELTTVLQQTPAAAAAVASRASAESNDSPSEHTDPVANSPTTNEGNELYPTETTSLLHHSAAAAASIGTLYEG
jgi:hypothetical protein